MKGEAVGLKDKGSAVFWLRHGHADWTTDANTYNFGMRNKQGISVMAVKRPDRIIEIKLVRPFYEVVTFYESAPKCDERGLMVTFTWQGHEVKLYFDGKPMDVKSTDPEGNSKAT